MIDIYIYIYIYVHPVHRAHAARFCKVPFFVCIFRFFFARFPFFFFIFRFFSVFFIFFLFFPFFPIFSVFFSPFFSLFPFFPHFFRFFPLFPFFSVFSLFFCFFPRIFRFFPVFCHFSTFSLSFGQFISALLLYSYSVFHIFETREKTVLLRRLPLFTVFCRFLPSFYRPSVLQAFGNFCPTMSGNRIPDQRQKTVSLQHKNFVSPSFFSTQNNIFLLQIAKNAYVLCRIAVHMSNAKPVHMHTCWVPTICDSP